MTILEHQTPDTEHRKPQERIEQKKQAILVSAGIGIGGSERVVLDLTRGLLERGNQVRSLFPGALDAASKRWLALDGLPVETHPAVLRIDAPRNRDTVRKLTDLLKESG